MRMIIKKYSIALFVLIFICMLAGQAFAQQKPNVILIFVDDLGYGDLGCYGQQMIQTPHLDALSSAGIRFTNYYAGNTVCAPSRESLLTGMHTGHTFIRGNFLTDEEEDPAMPDNKVTIAEYLKKGGYQTALIGKWGLGSVEYGPQTQGFDYSFCYLDQIKAHNYYPPYLWENGKMVMLEENENGVHGICSHDLFIKKTLDYLDTVSTDHPFFLYLPYTYPHGSYTVPEDSIYAREDWPKQNKVYASMISVIDRNIGQIVQQLQEKGLTENTVIFFTSDNGSNPGFAKFFESNGPLHGAKRDLYEGGIREPLIAAWQGKIKPGQVSHHIMAAWDFLPTICQIAGIDPPSGIDGISFLPALMNENQPEHDFLYWEFYQYNYNWYKPDNKLPRNFLQSAAVRFGQWKAVKNDISTDHSTIELYDLSNDLSEQHNVADENTALVKKAWDFMEKSSTPDPPYFPYKADSLAKLHVIDVHSPGEVMDFFHYTDDRAPFVSSHRGGPTLGYPENCMATFQNTIRHTWSIMEIDPHFTRDSAIVLMHDPTLDRTSTGHGKIADHTLAELKMLNLKDVHGHITKYRIPTLDEALEWAKGKTILIIDQKDVPAEIRVKMIMKHHAESNAMVMCYNFEDAKKCYALNKNIMMEVFIPDEESVKKFDATEVPWRNVVAFVSHNKPKDTQVFRLVHDRGAMCIMGSSRTIDKDYLNEKISKIQLNEGYQELINSGSDIIEADLGIIAGEELQQLGDPQSNKKKYFKQSTF